MPAPLNILVADDEPLNAMALKSQLESMGHSVVGPARDGKEAIDLARRHAADLAILDIRMPKLTGLQAAEEIFRDRPIPIILLTGYNDEASITAAVRGHIFQYLVKPVSIEDLAPAIGVARNRFEEWSEMRESASTLSRKLEDRKLIERAKGVLMNVRGLSEQEAYRVLQKESQNRNQSMAELASTILDADSLLRDA